MSCEGLSRLFLAGLFAASLFQGFQLNTPNLSPASNPALPSSEPLHASSRCLALHYGSWVDEDVAYLISPEEREAFLRLNSESECDQFIEQFWYRRRLNLDSVQNPLELEHYRRMAFANAHFASSLPGWKSDRGHAYVLFGPPDAIEAQPTRQTWSYRHLDGLGDNVRIGFVDRQITGDYSFANKAEAESLMQAFVTALAQRDFPLDTRRELKQHPGTIQYVGAQPQPLLRHKDLEALATSRILRSDVEFRYSTQIVSVTAFTSLITLRLCVGAAGMLPGGGPTSGKIALFARFSKPSGWVVKTIEDELPRNPLSAKPATDAQPVEFREQAPLHPGDYNLSLVVSDLTTGKCGTLFTNFRVPAVPNRGK